MTLIRRHCFRFLSIFCGLIFISACQQQNIRPTPTTTKPTLTDVLIIKIDLTQKKKPTTPTSNPAPALVPMPKVASEPVSEPLSEPLSEPVSEPLSELSPRVKIKVLNSQRSISTLAAPTPNIKTAILDKHITKLTPKSKKPPQLKNNSTITAAKEITKKGVSISTTKYKKDQRAQPRPSVPMRDLQWSTDHLADIYLNPPKRIALAMPLHGKDGKVGQAVVDGFMAAHFEAQAQLKQVPYIKMYDTGTLKSLDALYLKASADKIDIIIGPLEKDRVIELSRKEMLPIPTLALNYTPLDGLQSTTTNLVQFGLAVEDEATQIAQRSLADGHKRIIILHQNQPWAIRAAEHFTRSWVELGGQVADQVSFSGAGDHSKVITEALLITQSNERANTLRTHLSGTGNTIKSEPRRRQDVDAIVLFSLPTDGRQIIPTLAFHYAANLPVYASHHIYQGPTDTSRDRDLEKVMFTDLPWLIEPPVMQTKISQTWLERERYTRLFAMGVDAFQLFFELQEMYADSSKRLNGATGVLRMNRQGRIITQRSWGKFKSGDVVSDSNL